MKKIQLKVIPLGQGELNYKNELTTIFQSPTDTKVGAEVEEMRRSIRVLDKLEKAKDVLELEDADYAYLQERMRKARFGMVHPAILQFVEEMLGA